MTSLIRQSFALSVSNLKSIRRRLWLSISTAFSVAMVVTVLLGFLAMSNGFNKALVSAGSRDIAIGLAKGAGTELASQIDVSQIHQLDTAPGVARDGGSPILSAEMLVPVDGRRKSSGLASTLSLRGIGPLGMQVRPEVSIVQGRMFQEGSNEIIVGKRLHEDYAGLDLGEELRFGSSTWKVVGVFDAKGSALESEMLADLATVQTLFNRPNLVQSVRIKLSGADELPLLQSFVASNAQVDMSIRSEKEYFSGLAQRTSKLILFFGWPLAVVMAIGAVIGTTTTMFSSVADRKKEIATVRVLGFSRTAAFIGTWIEAMALTLLGCLAGMGFSMLVLNGWTASTVTSDQSHVGFQLVLSPHLLLQAFLLSLMIGAIGGGLPALGATRIPLASALSNRD